MVEYPDLQVKNILEIEPKYYNNLNIDGFSKMMKSPSYCYKFYWLEAIIQLISEGKTESTFDEIIDEMITNAWYSVRELHIHLSGMPLDGQIKDGLMSISRSSLNPLVCLRLVLLFMPSL